MKHVKIALEHEFTGGKYHAARHKFCSNKAKAGVNPRRLQYIVGHSDTSI
ncbi:hypothetical protein V1224_12455 [Lachnospiraceae bacterium JLR.KK008]